jgi:SAM-dependent methyltransferase
LENIVENKIKLNSELFWELDEKKKFDYSEGLPIEKYLENVFLKAGDLSSNSFELEDYIRDWPSEYHLSRKRSQLLRGFDFDKRKKVLEVGCGCGAITRYLGEAFEDIVAIEGSEVRARLARLRTKDLDNVSILCAPFHEIKFKQRFDIIFCIGVLEYSSMFVKAIDPYDYVLQYFHDILTPEGIVVIAIENQFGLKYFSSSREDHTNIMFDGLEGYPRYNNRQRTFGYGELKSRLCKYFKEIKFYFPYPDYKIPSCVFSEDAFKKIKLGELISKFPSRDYMGEMKPLFNEKFVLLELDKNNVLPFFSNSFLIFAGKHKIMSMNYSYLGLMYSDYRLKEFQTVTQIVEHEDSRVWANKIYQFDPHKSNSEMLNLCPKATEWIDSLSLHTQLMKRIKEENVAISELFHPCKIWLQKIKSLSTPYADKFMIDGKYIDSIWSNSYIKNNECYFIDDEWEWKEKISLNVLIIKSIYYFLYEIRNIDELNTHLKLNSTRKLITIIAESFGIKLRRNDFKEFCKNESIIVNIIFGRNIRHSSFCINLLLFNKSLFTWVEKILLLYKIAHIKLQNKLNGVLK